MVSKAEVPETVTAYIAEFPADKREGLEKMRELIRSEAPHTEEKISWRMPTYTIGGKNLVHFAGFKSHIGFYPTPEAIVAFKEKLTGYRTTKCAIQFPYDKPLPSVLISEIVRHRVHQLTGQQ